MITKTKQKQKWKSLGKIFCPSGESFWLNSHASCPVAEHIEEDLFRVYFSSREKDNKSHIGSLIVDINKSSEIIDMSTSPLLSPGESGAFDDSGVSLGSVVNVHGEKFLYYLGWNLGVTVPWRNSIGLAVFNEEKNKFEKINNVPILDRSKEDPYSLSYPFVLFKEGKYLMWYGSNTTWERKTIEDVPFLIKYAESIDGVNWNRENKICLDIQSEADKAFAKPFVLYENDTYKMWYSHRGTNYKIGYAESIDGISWNRHDDLVCFSGLSDWDNDSQAYPFVFSHKDRKYMLYNGNSYGKTGFGIAVLEEPNLL